MRVETDIGRRDLIVFNLLVTPRLRSTYVVLVLLVVGLFASLLWQDGVPSDGNGWWVLAVASIGGALGGLLVGFVFCLGMILLASSDANGLIGAHEFEIRPDGFAERTRATESFTRWSGIHSIRAAGPYLLVQIAPYLFHLVPRRSFADESQFRDFHAELLRSWNAARAAEIA